MINNITLNSRLQVYQKSTRESTLNLVRTHASHLVGNTDPTQNTAGTSQTSFTSMLLSQLDATSALEKNAEQLTTQFLVDPSSVNEHDVTIASTEATLALNLTTTIIDRALEAYRTIISMQ